MAYGLYKPGQGYWMRVLAACGAGIVVLAAAAWIWAQVGAINPPTSHWSANLVGISGTVTPGATIDAFLGVNPQTGEPERAGTVTVRSVEPAGRGLVVSLTSPQLRPNLDITGIRRLGVPDGSFAADVENTVRSVAMFEMIYVQAVAVTAVLILGALFIYWLVGLRAGTSEFLIATDGEMKKVNWSTRKDVIGSTWVVVTWCVLLASGLFVVDFLFSQFFMVVGVLER